MTLILDQAQLGYLNCIDEDHVDMIKMYEKVKKIVRANLPGPTTYLYPIYKYYFPLLSNKMKEMAQNIFAQYNLPDLPVSNTTILSKNVCWVLLMLSHVYKALYNERNGRK